MSLVFQEMVILILIILLAVFSAFRTKNWYIDDSVITIKIVKPKHMSLLKE